MGSPSPAEPAVRFRAGKRRKAYRQRAADSDGDEEGAAIKTTKTTTPRLPDAPASQARDGDESNDQASDKEEEEEESSVAAALRLRNARRAAARLNGVGFKSGAASKPDRDDDDDDDNSERTLVPYADLAQDKDAAALGGVANRFMHQTGLVADLNDRHMMAYIESRLSSRPSATTSHPPPSVVDSTATATTTTTTTTRTATTATTSTAIPLPATTTASSGAMRGHLQEIDLGAEARDYNVARTERAALGQPHEAEPSSLSGRRPNKRPRLGRDGKPRRPRNRRGSDALKRDQLVDDILRENRLDVYEAPAPSQPESSAANADGAADDRLAEQFRQQFLEDVAQRQLKRKKPANPPAKSEDVLKGPKLGGSRNVRAAMRDLLLKKEKEAKK